MRFVTLILALGLMTATASAGTFGDANDAYHKGEFSRAIELYEQIVQRGVVHEDLYYNLGNAYFRSGRLGPAIYNYERALRVHPDFADARYNLDVARDTVAERTVDRLKGAEEDPTWIRVVTFFSISELTIAFLVFDLLFFAGLVALRFVPTGFSRTSLVVVCAFLGVSLVTSGVLLERNNHVRSEIHQAVVVADLAIMREGPDASLAERGQLHPGLVVRVLEDRGDWARIRLANGVEGWVPMSAVGKL